MHFISKKEDIDLLDCLKSEPFIGIDTEWKPPVTKLDKTITAILQLSGQNVACIVDTISLVEN